MRPMATPGADRAGRTDLHNAALEGDAPRVRHLLEAGADPTIADAEGFTPLHLAAQQQQEAGVEALLAFDAPGDAVDGGGDTPLFRAVLSADGDPRVVHRLVGAGADPDLANAHGRSPRALARLIGNHDTSTYFSA